MPNRASARRIVLTLDAGGTSFRFSAWRANRRVTKTISTPSHGDDLDRCLATMVGGFEQVWRSSPERPVAISFAFPGPADYPNGIIGDLGNLPGFRGGVALAPMLERRFGVPVFINNDGDLFAYGEAIAGFLPHVNGLLARAGSPKRYHNLLGVTLGTGLGGGIVRNGELFLGDNSIAGEMWLLRNKIDPRRNAEEGASIRAIRRVYAERAGMALSKVPEPKDIAAIAQGKKRGNRAAAREAFRRLGEATGDAMAQALTLVDGLAVIGGGISAAAPLFLPALVKELNGTYIDSRGRKFPRLASVAYNLEDAAQRLRFVRGNVRTIGVPGARARLKYDSERRVGVGLSRLGTSEAIAIGACAFALHSLDARR